MKFCTSFSLRQLNGKKGWIYLKELYIIVDIIR